MYSIQVFDSNTRIGRAKSGFLISPLPPNEKVNRIESDEVLKNYSVGISRVEDGSLASLTIGAELGVVPTQGSCLVLMLRKDLIENAVVVIEKYLQ